MAEVGEIHRDFVDALSPPVKSMQHAHCALFEFALKAAMTGPVCLAGFAANTVCFMGLWRERRFSPSTFLVQAIVIADFAVLWMLFVGESLPALGYVIPVLRDCSDVCGYVKAVSRPLLFLAHVCVVWFTTMTAVNRFVVMSRPAQADAVSSVDYARKRIIVITLCAVLLTLPLTFDSALTMTFHTKDSSGQQSDVTHESLSQNRWYRLLYVHAAVMLLVYVLPLATLSFVGLRLWCILSALRRLRRAVAATYRTQHMDSTQVSMTLAVVLVICYLPLLALRAVEWADEHLEEGALARATCGKLQYYLAAFSTLFLAINSSIKLLVLGLFSPTFVAQLRNYWKCFCCAKGSNVKCRDTSITDSMYKCRDMSEMTLISQVETR